MKYERRDGKLYGRIDMPPMPARDAIDLARIASTLLRLPVTITPKRETKA